MMAGCGPAEMRFEIPMGHDDEHGELVVTMTWEPVHHGWVTTSLVGGLLDDSTPLPTDSFAGPIDLDADDADGPIDLDADADME